MNRRKNATRKLAERAGFELVAVHGDVFNGQCVNCNLGVAFMFVQSFM